MCSLGWRYPDWLSIYQGERIVEGLLLIDPSQLRYSILFLLPFLSTRFFQCWSVLSNIDIDYFWYVFSDLKEWQWSEHTTRVMLMSENPNTRGICTVWAQYPTMCSTTRLGIARIISRVTVLRFVVARCVAFVVRCLNMGFYPLEGFPTFWCEGRGARLLQYLGSTPLMDCMLDGLKNEECLSRTLHMASSFGPRRAPFRGLEQVLVISNFWNL